MSLFSTKERRKQTEHYVALDLGTESIKCLIFEKNESQGTVLGKGHSQHAPGSMRGGMMINIPEASGQIKKAIDQAAEQAGVNPQSLIISMSGDLVKSLVTTVHYRRSQPESHIDAAELKNIVYKVQLKAFEQMREVLSREQDGDTKLDVKLINTTVVDTRVDGYKIANPLGFQGGKVTLSIFNIFAPLVHLGALQSVADSLDMDLISVAAGPYAFTRSLIVQDPEFSGIFIDIGANMTDVAVVDQGGISGIQNFALGGSAFDRNLARSLKTSVDKAEQIKIDYSSGLLDKQSETKLHTPIKDTATIWASGVAEALDEFHHLDVLPNRLFVGGGSAHLPEIKNILLTKGWAKSLPFTKKPYPQLVNPTAIADITIANEVSLDLSDLVTLGLVYLTLETNLTEDVVGDMLKRIVLSMQT